MSKEEAIKEMIAGNKVTHKFFVVNEWIKMDGFDIVTEEQYRFSPQEFWKYRKSRFWETDWNLFKSKPPQP